ncbi:orotate phosphoribosyltransferase [Halobacillus sp. ACCC02827]|uniref:orotate phosphoribosyltransferase n=1 Tax=Bacillaceae TaxID=186817 RepID=UPI00041690D9|nr:MULTISPECIES: orotate phosphoribosyltransferase [Bacillaceae]QHT46588.1 orotate phosphoribosyltransferase [Bacillus sp. SB49]WJE17401.1 orotate phosphoribosyltransferase [Halobacillus sp. ACCC02827]
MDNRQLIHDLLSIGAVKIETEDFFTWTSGIKSPIYCDNRLTMSYPEIRKKIIAAFIEKIEELGEEVDVIAGCATAGIPHAAWIAEKLELPMVYVRASAKKHGKGNQIEGRIRKGQKAVVIEDLISTGKSSIQAAEALQKEGVEVLEVLSIFTYGLHKADEAFKEAGLSYRSITSYENLLNALVDAERMNEEERRLMAEWRQDPYIFTQT